MAIFKCKMCGGALEVTEGQSVATCEYCGTQQTLPQLNDEKIAFLHDRANYLRRNSEYDKALSKYEEILDENKEDAEAYWSIVLCRYGIEYVEDPRTKMMMPTINRAQLTSILADPDYKSALKYADALQRGIYEREGKTIDEIQKNILKVVQNEKPYDVFICYKDKDNNGQPTEDRVIASEFYNRLTREKFRVFFAHYSLDDKLGREYEPYIFAALQSAKVMIVVGTKPEYFNAVWVRNEWSRYLTLIRGGAKKTLIAAYKNMEAYDMPEELGMQAQDMSKMGFIENLVYNVRREVERNTEQKKPTGGNGEDVVIKGASANVVNLIKRAFMSLEDGLWQDATMYCEKALNLDPECGAAYAGKLLAELRVKNFDMLGGYSTPFDDHASYKRAIQFADDDLMTTLETSLFQIKYRNACAFMERRQWESAKNLFEEILAYKDARQKAEECGRIINEEVRKKAEAERLRKEEEERANDRVRKARRMEELRDEIKRGSRFVELREKTRNIVVLAMVYLVIVLFLIPTIIGGVIAEERWSVMLLCLLIILNSVVLYYLQQEFGSGDLHPVAAAALSLFLNILTFIYTVYLCIKTVINERADAFNALENEKKTLKRNESELAILEAQKENK